MIYIKKRISFKHRQDLQQHNSIENIFIEIIVKKQKPIIFRCFYRPPDSSKYLSKDFNDLLEENLDRVASENKETIIMGDFNIDYNNRNDSHSHQAFKNTMTMHGFKQIVNNSTRITNDSSTLIDHIFVTKPSCFPFNKSRYKLYQ